MRFYQLVKYPWGDAETEATEEKGYRQGDAAKCPSCGAYVSMLEWLPPYRVELELFGTMFGDLVFLSGGANFLVSQKFRDAYFENGLTGLSGFELVEVIGVKSRRRKPPGNPPTYFRVIANYGQTVLDLAASGFEWLEQPTCHYCWTATLVRWKGLILKDGTWTGEDIFRPRGSSGHIIVSQRFKDACELNGIKNAVFEPAETAAKDYYPGKVVPPYEAPQ